MKYFKNFETLQDLKTQYRAFAKQLHPDCGGDAKAFTEMNAEYQQALEMLERGGAKAYNQKQGHYGINQSKIWVQVVSSSRRLCHPRSLLKEILA